MASARISASWLYLRDATPETLQAFELSRLNLASCLRKQIEALVIQYLDEVASAMLARELLNGSHLLDRDVRSGGAHPSDSPGRPSRLLLPRP